MFYLVQKGIRVGEALPMQYQPKRGERDCRPAVLSMVLSFYYEE
jgi:hypothetical protein